MQQKCKAGSDAHTQATAPAKAFARRRRRPVPCQPPAPAPSAVAETVGNGIPQGFVMKNTTKFADPMLAFSDRDGAELGGLADRQAGLGVHSFLAASAVAVQALERPFGQLSCPA